MNNLDGEMLVGRVGFGESFQACPANYSAEDSMAASIVRLECEAEELRAEVAILQEQARILAEERDEAIAARKSSAADWLNQVEQANARVSRALRQVARAEQERDQARAMQKWGMRRELEELLGVKDTQCDEQFAKGVAALRDLIKERDEARAETEWLRAAVSRLLNDSWNGPIDADHPARAMGAEALANVKEAAK